MLMSAYVKNNLNSIWSQTLKLIEESEYFDSATFNAFIVKSTLYDIIDDLAIISVPSIINKKVFDDVECLSFVQQKLSEVMDQTMYCEARLKKDIEAANANQPAPKKEVILEDKLLDKYTFDNFIVGQSNRESHAAALSCAMTPGKFFNPLFIFGNSGLGKTHLLHAIGNYVKQNQPDKKVLYIYSEDFITLVVNSIKDKTIEEVKEAICNVDYLLIDDIQRLAQWGRSQEIFFNLYNKLISNDKQVIITSDIHPSELKGIETRLISRFSSGLSVGIDSPEFETAYAILEKKLEGRQEEVLVQREVLEYIANRFSADVRSLEGALNNLIFKAILFNPELIDLKFAVEVFKENPAVINQDDTLSVMRIKKAVCEFYGLTRQQIESKSRTKSISNARHIAIYLCRKHMDLPFSKIGAEFGGRDHSTIMSSYDKMTKSIKQNDMTAQAVGKIESKLGIS